MCKGVLFWLYRVRCIHGLLLNPVSDIQGNCELHIPPFCTFNLTISLLARETEIYAPIFGLIEDSPSTNPWFCSIFSAFSEVLLYFVPVNS